MFHVSHVGSKRAVGGFADNMPIGEKHDCINCGGSEQGAVRIGTLNPGRSFAHFNLLHGRAKQSQWIETGKGNNGIRRFPVCWLQR